MFKKPGTLRLIAIVLAVALTGIALSVVYISRSKERLVLGAAALVSFRYNTGLADSVAGLTARPYNSAARSLQLILGLFNVKSQRVNMALRYGGAHSALIVNVDGKDAYVDPYYGYAAINDEGHLVSIDELWANLSGGKDLSRALRAIALFPDDTFYERWHSNNLTYSMQGSPMTFVMRIPPLKDHQDRLIGIANGSTRDVYVEGEIYGFTPYWTYLGNRYDAAWARRAKATEDVTLEATAITDIDPKIIKSDPPPSYIHGRQVGWNLSAGQTLTLYQDGIDGDQDIDFWTVKPKQ